MQFQLHAIVHGFQITHIYPLQDWNGTLYQMKHLHSGAELCYFDRKDDNKTFAISFKTLPENDTGVFHILEHSVLNGSDKYPVKEPFVELLKSSMQTFLNAMTYSDKTVYPVSSKSEKDFRNLASIYLDAVFHPSIYNTPNIFYQEGWHYEVEDETSDPSYNGVVFNEMKGAFSSVDTLLINSICRQTLKDTCYAYVSGGDPSHITDLTYEQFIETHKKFYHPSNARIWLEGTLDVEWMMEYLDAEYLSHYEDTHTSFNIPLQKKLPADTVVLPYEISLDQPEEKQCHICYSNVVSTYKDVELNLAMGILSNALTTSTASALTKPFIEAGLAQDVEFDLLDGIQQPVGVITFRNTEKESEKDIRALLHTTVENLVHGGLDHEALFAAINQSDFAYRESHEPTGIYHVEDALSCWLYQEDPTPYLSLSTVFDDLRKKVEEGWFETVLADFLLDDAHLQTTIAVPDKTLAQKLEEKEREKLHAIRSGWKDVSVYTQLCKDLKTWQTAPNTPEQLATLPKLDKEDIPPLKDPHLPVPHEENGVPVLTYTLDTNGIAYTNYYFNISGIQTDLLPAFSFFTSILADIPTQQHDLVSLHAAIQRDIGNLGISVVSYSPVFGSSKTTPMIAVRTSALPQNIEKTHALVMEILQHSLFTSDTVYPLLKQKTEQLKQLVNTYGHLIASVRAKSHCSADGVFAEYTAGYSFYQYLLDFENHYEERIEEFIELCHLFADNIFVKSRLTVTHTLHSKDLIASFLKDIPLGDGYCTACMHYPFVKGQKEAIVIPGGVGYSAFTIPTDRKDISFDLFCHIMSYDWLWNEVRVKGGAYGTGMRSNSSGCITAYTYRDPSASNLLHALEDITDYADSLDDAFPLTQYLIGAVGASLPLLSVSSRINLYDAKYFSHIPFELSVQFRQRLVDTTLQDIKSEAKILKEALHNSYQCVVGPQDMLDTLEGFTVLK